MSLKVGDRSVTYGPTADSFSLYVGNEVNSNLDAIRVVVEATEPDPVLRVSKMEAYR